MKYSVEKNLDSLGRLVIPKNLRDFYRIKLGDTLELVPTERGILITKPDKSDTEASPRVAEERRP